MKKAVIYTRVSSEEQVKGYSLDSQEEKLKEYCKQNELAIFNVYREEGISGAKKNRPELDKLMIDAKERKFDVVLVYKLDRFSRNLRNLLDLLNDLENCGVGFKSITETFDTTTPMGKYMLHNMGSIAELERGLIRERTIEGQKKYRAEGNWHGSIPPYGYNYNKETNKLEINQEEAIWVKKMFKWYVDGKLSLHKIQVRINELKVPTKFDNLGREKTVNGKGWWKKRTISRIIESEVYSGTFTYCKYKHVGRVRGENNLRPKEDWIVISTPAIISKDLFNLAQKQVQDNKRFSKRNSKHNYLFAHLLECGKCRGKYGSYFHKNKHSLEGRKRYMCYNSLAWIKKDTCQASTVSESRLDEPIWNSLSELILNPKIVFKQLDEVRKKQMDNAEVTEKIKELDELIKVNKGRLKKLVDLYLDSSIDKDSYEERLKAINENLTKYQNEKNELDKMIMPKIEKRTIIQSLGKLFDRLKFNIKDINYSQKREIIKLLVDKIVIEGKKVQISCNLINLLNYYSLGDSQRIY